MLTIPLGRDAVFAPLTRVYGKERLPHLLDGYTVEKESFWVKDQENRWVQTDKETALNFEASAGSWDPLQNVLSGKQEIVPDFLYRLTFYVPDEFRFTSAIIGNRPLKSETDGNNVTIWFGDSAVTEREWKLYFEKK